MPATRYKLPAGRPPCIPVSAQDSPVTALARFCRVNRPLFVLTGAGCSTDSGIPDYRDENGAWKHQRPVMYTDFLADPEVRRRYWFRSSCGWPRVRDAVPNAAHYALAGLQASGVVRALVTQNVDGLHRQAGSAGVIELHGNLDTVSCTGCGARVSRSRMQTLLEEGHAVLKTAAGIAPDGDAWPQLPVPSDFTVPSCRHCGGILRPDVIFFGEAVPKECVQRALAALDTSRGVLVVGSSLMLLSGFRFCRAAAERGLPMAAVNVGYTRADPMLALKVRGRCAAILPQLLRTGTIAAASSPETSHGKSMEKL